MQVSLNVVQEAFNLDGGPTTLRVMHGIRGVHLSPNNFERMRVNYAFQLFGSQVQRGLRFFKEELEASGVSVRPTLRFFE